MREIKRRKGKLTDLQREEVLLQYECGRSMHDIAKDYDIHPTYVRAFARRRGIVLSRQGRRKRWKEYTETNKDLEQDICTNGWQRIRDLSDV